MSLRRCVASFNLLRLAKPDGAPRKLIPALALRSLDLTPSQIARLEKTLQAGFRFITLERHGRCFGVARDGFAVLIDPADGQLRTYGQAGYLIGDGIAMLVERGGGKAFVWHRESVPATPALLAAYDSFRTEIENLLREKTDE